MAHGWPSASLWSDEAGIVLGNHSMQSNPTRFVALLNRLWDGKNVTAHRKTSTNCIIQNRRLTLNLMMQSLLLKQLTNQATGINRQSGFLARCLMAYPTSSMGQRFYQEPPDSLACLQQYEQRITDCLNQSTHLGLAGCIKLPTLIMGPSAKQAWICFFNAVEVGLKPQGQWSDIKDFASKAAENVARLAALFHLFTGNTGDIAVEHMEQAITIIHWHLEEAKRLFSVPRILPNLDDAIKLKEWLVAKMVFITTPRKILQFSPLRDKVQRDRAIEILINHHQIRFTKIDNKTAIELNPHCL